MIYKNNLLIPEKKEECNEIIAMREKEWYTSAHWHELKRIHLDSFVELIMARLIISTL